MDPASPQSDNRYISWSLRPYDLFGEYQIEAKLGEGAVATVYRAYHRPSHTVRALKILRPEHVGSAAMRLLLEREGMILARMQHADHPDHPRPPGVVVLLDQGEANGLAYLALDYVDGSTLRDQLLPRYAKRLKPRYAVELAAQAAEILDWVHTYFGVTHCDIRPENLYVTPLDRPRFLVRVGDFGLAHLPEPDLTRKLLFNFAMGTVEYMAPEVVQGTVEVDGRVDIYSLGVVLYEMITGGVPYRATSVPDLLVQLAETTPLPLSQFLIEPHTGVNAVVRRALAITPDERWSTMHDFVYALRWLQQRY